MKTSLNWLSDYVPLPDDHRELTERLTLAGLEVEGIEVQGDVPDGVVVGEILSRSPHPDADRLSVCSVNVGGDEPLQIVCGAPNCDAGRRVPVATVGTNLGEGFKIKKTKLRGVASRGMMCSADELGLGGDHSGLLILPDAAEIGAPVSQWVERDVVVDWEVTPNRPDWLSHLGIAREIAAVTDCADRFALPKCELSPVPGTRTTDAASVEVRDATLCPRYVARVIRNVTVGPSPEWMQTRLRAVGLRPINNIVDITNFVLMECGHPLHAFDRDRLAGHAIVVRRAEEGETLRTLDDQDRHLTPNDLVIADSATGVAVAGVMGGGDSEISDATTTVLLESAVFQPSSVRATSRRLGLSTDSSQRFERGVSVEMAEFASRRAAALICELAGGEVLDDPIDVCASSYEPHTVVCRARRANQLLGTSLSAQAMATYLRRLQLPVEEDGEALSVAVPSFRLDIEREADLIEEIARIHGLNNLPPARVHATAGGSLRDDAGSDQEQARAELLALGLDETMTYTYQSQADALLGTDLPPEAVVVLANPLSADTAALRTSLLPGMMHTLSTNIARGNATLRLFEMGRVFSARGAKEERLQVAILLTGSRHPERIGPERTEALDFYDLKGVLTRWMAARRLPEAECRAAQHPAFADGQCAELMVAEKPVAVFGQVAENLVSGIRLRTPVYLALVEMDEVFALESVPDTFTPLPTYPATDRDISMIAPNSLSAGEIRAAVLAMNVPTLERVEVTDVYEDAEQLGQGRRSLTFSLTYRHPERTLKDEEVNDAQECIRADLAKSFDIELR